MCGIFVIRLLKPYGVTSTTLYSFRPSQKSALVQGVGGVGGVGRFSKSMWSERWPLHHLWEMQSATGEASPESGDGWRPRQVTQPAAIVDLGSGGRITTLKQVVDTAGPNLGDS